MELDEIVARLAETAEFTPEEAARYRPLCETAGRQVFALAREGTDETGKDFLYGAAAALAFYRLAMRQAAGGLDGFSVGDLKIAPSGKNVEFARLLWRDAQAAAAPWLKDMEFVFAGVAQ